MENLLYYPYINLPKTDWTARILLYYDKIGSIVPENYFYNPELYEPFMRHMIREELVLPINPLETLDKLWELSDIFIDYIHGRDFKLNERVRFFQEGRQGRIHRQKFVGTRIHINKFESEIFYQLSEVGLARKENYEWYIVEEYTAGELMTFLATVIGDKLNFQPTTDIIKPHLSLTGNNSNNDFKIRQFETEKREIILRELIPFPLEIDLIKLRRFKEKHFDLLKLFKNKVETIALDPNINANSQLFKTKIDELKDSKQELSDRMNESKLGGVIFGTICGAVGAFIGLLTTSTTGAFIGALPGFANAIYSALQIETPEKLRDQSGLKYLALIDKQIRRNINN